MAKKGKGRVGRTARRIGAGLKSRLPGALRGGAVGAVAQMAEDFGAEHVGFVREKWYGAPAVYLAGALLLPGRAAQYAGHLAAIAGYSGTFNWKLKQFQEGKRATSPVRMFNAAEQPAQLAPPAGAGALQMPGQVFDDAAALQYPQ